MNDLKNSTRYINPTKNLRRYYLEVSKEKLVHNSEEEGLILLAKKGDDTSRNKLIKGNLRFVISVAKSYSNNPTLLLDLISEGNKGLIEAIENYDPTRGFRFISYAVWHIKKNILAYLNNQHSIRIPGNINSEIRRYNKIAEYFTRINQREPIIDDILNIIENEGLQPLSQNSIDVLRNKPHTIPIDSKEPDDEIDTRPILWLASGKNPEELIIDGESRIRMSRLLHILPKREKEIIELRYGLRSGTDEMSLNEISSILKISTERVRQIKGNAEKKIKNYMIKNNLATI